MEQIQYSLVVSTQSSHQYCVRSSDLQYLRSCGPDYARTLDIDGEILLVGPYGNTVEKYDVWTNKWTT